MNSKTTFVTVNPPQGNLAAYGVLGFKNNVCYC